MPLGLPVDPLVYKINSRLLAVEGLGGVVGGNPGCLVVPPGVASGFHLDGVFRALQDDDAFHLAVAVLERGVDVGLERHDLAAPPAAVGGDDELRTAVREPVLDGVRAEPAEDHRMHRADPRAGEHGNRRFRHQRQVEDDPIPRRDPLGGQDVGKFANLRVQFPVSERAPIAGFAFPDDRGLVGAGGEVAVHAVGRDVEPPADETIWRTARSIPARRSTARSIAVRRPPWPRTRPGARWRVYIIDRSPRASRSAPAARTPPGAGTRGSR